MNERIKLLLEQAISDVDYIHFDDKIDAELAEMFIPDVFAQRFAELLIKECAMIVEGFILEQEVALDDYQEYEASAVLKEHFGVEE